VTDLELLAAIAGVFGLLFGSFLNVCVGRLPQDLSVVSPRSYCPACGTTLKSWHNIPVLSYLVLGGRCAFCRTYISWRYPFIELLTGICFWQAVLLEGPTWGAFKLCVYSWLLIALMFSDLEWRILPDEFTKGGMVLGIFLAPIVPLPAGLSALIFPDGSPALLSLIEALIASAVLSAALWSLGWAYQRIRGREGLGFGDVKLVGMIGAFTGLSGALFVLVIGSVAGTVIGLLWIWLRRHDASSYELPFGTFLAGSALVFAFVGRSFFMAP